MNWSLLNLFLVIIFTLIIESYEWRIFHKGRQVGGNLGVPKRTKLNSNSINYTDVPTQWFQQILDHFTPTDDRTWKQRYYVSEQYYNPVDGNKGPVFLYIGGEGEVNATWTLEGQWMNYAEQFDALCFILEHRYYGKSHPTPDMSTKNLQYLSSEQALEDLAYFIQEMNKKYDLEGAKWIAFGGSYPGSLAAWLRYKYPHLITGSMSASGPLLAKPDFLEYFAVVENSLQTHSDKCVDAVLSGTNQIEILLKHMIGMRELNQKFNLCDPLENSTNIDISNFFETLSGNFAGVVQYNKDNREGKFPKAAKITIDILCDIMVNESLGAEVNRLAKVNALLLDVYEQKCLDYKYSNMIDALRDVKWNSSASEGGRQWTYQTCTEFGFYQTSSHKPQLFGHRFPLDFFIQQCEDIFGPKFNLDFLNRVTENTNTFYGALNLEVTNVVFVHGSIDPWHALGITQTVSNEAPAIYINGTAHCANMYPSSPDDLPSLKAAREQVGQLIDSWLRLG